MLSMRHVVAGPGWHAISFGDGLLSRCVVCTHGACLIGMLPMTDLRSSAMQAKVSSPVISHLADELGSLSPGDVRNRGGSFALLQEGDGVVVPAGHVFFQCCLPYARVDKCFLKKHKISADCGVAFVVPLLPNAHKSYWFLLLGRVPFGS